jgi:multidrug efflux pump subunit AcrA (membrane-fusion protein)
VAEDGRARLRLVRTGRRLGDEVEVVSGMEGGETVVVENASALLDGQPLQIP